MSADYTYRFSIFLLVLGVLCLQPSRTDGLIRALVHNFSTVEPGQFYRSGHLTTPEMDLYIKKYGFRTIINLRGAQMHRRWWYEEHALCERYGIRMYDFYWRARAYPTEKQMRQLMWVYRNSPKPILVHCAGGADRSGELSALWLLERGHPLSIALKQLTWKFRHLSWKFPKKRTFVRAWAARKWAVFDQFGQFQPIPVE